MTLHSNTVVLGTRQRMTRHKYVVHHTLDNLIRSIPSYSPIQCDFALVQAECSYNNMVNRTKRLGRTPFEIVYGRTLQHTLDLGPLLPNLRGVTFQGKKKTGMSAIHADIKKAIVEVFNASSPQISSSYIRKSTILTHFHPFPTHMLFYILIGGTTMVKLFCSIVLVWSLMSGFFGKLPQYPFLSMSYT